MKIEKTKEKVYILNDEQKEIAYVLFPKLDEQTAVIESTFVDSSLRGMGIAQQLLQAAYEVLKASNLKVIVHCSYAEKWFLNNPKYQDILK